MGHNILGRIRDAELTVTIGVVLVVIGIGLFLYLRSRKKIAEIVLSESSSEITKPE